MKILIMNVVFIGFSFMPANGRVYEALGIADFVPIHRHKRRCGAEHLF